MIRKFFFVIFSALFLSLSLSCEERKMPFVPFYTGPLIAPSGHNVTPGYVNLQPYIYLQNSYGKYNHKGHRSKIKGNRGTLEFYSLAKAGVTKVLELGMTNMVYYNTKNNQSSWNYGDTTLRLALQLLEGHPKWYIPDLRLVVRQVFPTGKYQNLDPRKDRIDATGEGSYKSGLTLASQFYLYNFKLLPSWNPHPLRLRFAVGYLIPYQCRVKNYNTFGGGVGTDGKVRAGNSFRFVGAFEYSFTQRWVLATDLQITDRQRATFKGKYGHIGATSAKMGVPSNSSISLAPGIEYNISDNFGFLSGVWFPIGGRNSPIFINYILSATYVF